MRQIDNMTLQEIETLAAPTTMTREQRLEATLIGIKQALKQQGGYEKTISVIDAALRP